MSVLKKQNYLFNYLNKFFKINLYQFKEKLNKKIKLIENNNEINQLNYINEENENINLIYKKNSYFFNNFNTFKIIK
jgi:hypothetical protein